MASGLQQLCLRSRGIQTYFTAPLRFREVSLEESMLVGALGGNALSLAMLAWRVGLPSAHMLVALARPSFHDRGQLTVANWSSITFRAKMEFGQMRRQRQSGMAVLVAFASKSDGGISALILFSGNWSGNPGSLPKLSLFSLRPAVGGYSARWTY